jgi:hypothetical protein
MGKKGCTYSEILSLHRDEDLAQRAQHAYQTPTTEPVRWQVTRGFEMIVQPLDR